MARRTPRWARTEREARSRTLRKLAAIENHAKQLCEESASYWDEGIVSTALDQILESLAEATEAVRSAMDDQIALRNEEEV